MDPMRSEVAERVGEGRGFSHDANSPRASAFRCAAPPAASFLASPAAHDRRLTSLPVRRIGRLGRDPSTQPGTPRWTHPHVTPSKQKTGVESARNSIPALRPSVLAVYFALLLAILLAIPYAQAQSPNLKATGYVNDFAGVISQSAKDQLTALCTEVQQKTQAQIAVVTIKSLDGQSIDQYAPDLFAKFGIGNKRTNDGVLILLAVDDRRYRIEVGYGLEPILPDGKVGGFGREAVPFLKQGDYSAAVLLMARRVADVIAADKGVTLSAAPAVAPPLQSQPQGGLNIPPFLILFLIIIGINLLFRLFRPRGSGVRRGGSGWWMGPMIGGGMGGGGWGGGGGFGGGGGGFGGFGGGMSGGGGASGGW